MNSNLNNCYDFEHRNRKFAGNTPSRFFLSFCKNLKNWFRRCEVIAKTIFVINGQQFEL